MNASREHRGDVPVSVAMNGDADAGGSMARLQRFCVKVYAPEAGIGDEVFVPIFHEWIRDGAFAELVLFDVADYTHAPASPGVMLVSHETAFALDRSDGRFGLLAQRRRPQSSDTADSAMAKLLRQVLAVADRLQVEPLLAGRLVFDRSLVRIEANDRLLAPNTDPAYAALAPLIRAAVAAVAGSEPVRMNRVANDPRDRLAIDVHLAG